VSTSLLNWDNHIVYDGLMMHKGALQKDVLKRALQAYVKVIMNRFFVVKGPITHASDFLFPLSFYFPLSCKGRG